MSSCQVVVHTDAELLAAAIAARLITKLTDAQAARGSASVVLTGGGLGIATLAAVAASPAREAISWRDLHIWWGDERFVPANDPDRNELQAREALLDQVDLDPAHIHPMGASDGPDGNNPELAAARYANELARFARRDQAVPNFDVLLLSVGPDGHVASIFPESPTIYDTGTVAAVHGSPKPPPTRLSLTFASIRAADEVWLLAAGTAKAAAVGLALAGAGATQIPAVGAYGGVRTLVLLDRAAAARVPSTIKTAY